MRCFGCAVDGCTEQCRKCGDRYCENCVNLRGRSFMCVGAYLGAPDPDSESGSSQSGLPDSLTGKKSKRWSKRKNFRRICKRLQIG